MTIETLLLAVLSALGFVTAWERTMLKTHVMGLFVPGLKGKTSDQVTDHIALNWGSFGELLNCKYCLSCYAGLGFMLMFSAMPIEAARIFSAFFIMPALIDWLLFPAVDQGVLEETVSEDDKSNSSSTADNVSWKLEIPDSIRERFERVKKDPEAHKKFLQDNSDILRIISTKQGCDFPGCDQLLEAYNNELQQMIRHFDRNKESCPDCIRGSVINKYLFLLYDKKNNKG